MADHGRITAWLEVRVLPSPPRILVLTEISRNPAIRLELAELPSEILSLHRRPSFSKPVSAPLSLPWKFRFPATETSVRRDRFECNVGEGNSFAHGVESSGRTSCGPALRLFDWLLADPAPVQIETVVSTTRAERLPLIAGRFR